MTLSCLEKRGETIGPKQRPVLSCYFAVKKAIVGPSVLPIFHFFVFLFKGDVIRQSIHDKRTGQENVCLSV